MTRERFYAALGLALGAAVGVAAALALSGCGQTRFPDGHISDAHLRSMVADFNASQHSLGPQ